MTNLDSFDMRKCWEIVQNLRDLSEDKQFRADDIFWLIDLPSRTNNTTVETQVAKYIAKGIQAYTEEYIKETDTFLI